MWLAMAVLTQLFPVRQRADSIFAECIRVAPMPVAGLGDMAQIAQRYPTVVIRIDTATLKRMPMPVDRRVPCYQLDSTPRK